MMKNLFAFIFLTLLLPLATSVSLEGQWTLIQILGDPLNIPITIEEFIFRQQSIVNKLQFDACQSLTYQVHIEQDNFYLLKETEWQTPTRSCTPQEFQQLTNIKKWIARVLKFSISNDRLTLSDPSNDPVFQFQRRTNSKNQVQSITGEWTSQLVHDPKTTHILIADGSELSICSGAIFRYRMPARYYMSIEIVSEGNCQDFALFSNLQKTVFIRKRQNRIQLFDNQINLLMTAFLKPNGRTTIPKSQPLAPIQISQTTKPIPQTAFSSGTYFLLMLFNRGSGRRRLQITQSKMTLNLCSTLVFTFKVQNQSKMVVSSTTPPDPNCSRANEKLFFDTLISSIAYKMDPDGSIVLFDKLNREIIALNRQ